MDGNFDDDRVPRPVRRYALSLWNDDIREDELVEEMGFKTEAFFEPFEATQTGRELLVLGLKPPRSKHPVGGTNSPSSRNSLTL